MIFARNLREKVTFRKAAIYLFLFALCAKGVALYATHHPLKDELLVVEGVVRKVRLGGEGRATRFRIESGHGTHDYSSYYGKVWPGMELIEQGDRLVVLAERNKLNRDELITGKRYYIWELVHDSRVIVAYEDVRKLVQSKDIIANKYVNIWLAVSAVFLVVTYLWKPNSEDEGL